MKQIFRKELKRKVIGNKEVIINEYYEDNLLSDEELKFIIDYFGDDFEYGIDKGVFFDFNDELAFIDVDKFSGEVNDLMEFEHDDILESINNKLSKYKGKGFDLFFSDD